MRGGGAALRVLSHVRGRDVSLAGGRGCGEDAVGETTADYPSELGEGGRGAWGRGTSG